MKPTRVTPWCAHFDDGTCWALPACPDDDFDKDQAALATLCYGALIALPQRKRNARIKAIREAMARREPKP